MKKMILSKILMSFLFSSLFINCSAQDSSENEKAGYRYLNSLLKDNFSFESPGVDFVLMDDQSGYRRNEDNAAIKFILMGGNYNELVNIFKDSIKNGAYLLVDSSTVQINNKTGFYYIEKQIPPPGSGYPNYYAINILIPLDQYLSLFLVGIYPESQDAITRKKFINSAFSIKKVIE